MSQYQRIDQAFTAVSPGGVRAEPSYSGALSFMRRGYSKDLSAAKMAVTGVPFDTATSNRPGARFGPRGIRAASTELAWQRNWPWEFDVFAELPTLDYGDCLFDYGRPERVPDAIQAHAKGILDQDCAMLAFGGDHFLTLPLLRAHAAKHGPLALLHFDAHTDSWKDPEERIDHGTMFYHAVKEGLIVPQHSVQAGIRTTNDDPLGLTIRSADWVHEHGAAALIADIKRLIGNHPTYLTFDIDCVDPAFAPGTGTPVCGGLTAHQALSILRGLRGLNLVGMDVVEVSPPYDHAEVTALLGATLAYDMLCLYACRHQRGERF